MPRVYERKFDWDEAKRLRAKGSSYETIARHFGVSTTAVARIVNPEFGKKLNARCSEWHRGKGKCEDCGTSIYRTRIGERRRCVDCATKCRTKVRDGKAYCPTCSTWKPLDEFSPSEVRKARGVHSECRLCDTKRRQAWRAANIERERETWRRAWRKRRETARA